jgi:hypothetical protein
MKMASIFTQPYLILLTITAIEFTIPLRIGHSMMIAVPGPLSLILAKNPLRLLYE